MVIDGAEQQAIGVMVFSSLSTLAVGVEASVTVSIALISTPEVGVYENVLPEVGPARTALVEAFFTVHE